MGWKFYQGAAGQDMEADSQTGTTKREWVMASKMGKRVFCTTSPSDLQEGGGEVD